jgi:hypothetical protein
VGGVSERAGAKAGGSNPFARTSFACRDGERHPGLLEGGVLRGASSERGSWSAHPHVAVSSAAGRRADDSGCPEVAEEGNVVSMRSKRMRPRQAREIVACAQGTRPSLGPSTRARRSSLCTADASLGGGAFESASRLGKPTHVGGTSTGAGTDGRSAARRVPPLPQGRSRGAFRKGRRSRPPSLRGSEGSGLVARTSIVVAEVGRRRLVSNKLGTRAPKRAVRVE